tara:strand:+ start:3266 stop:3466 length:201 start_codon:yes stop_codon:yes gene_type:complete
VRQRSLYEDAVTVAQILPGIGNPLELSMVAFRGIVMALTSKPKADQELSHRERVEEEMRRMHGNSR